MPYGASISQILYLGFLRLVAIKPPTTLDTNSARLVFLVSNDNSTYSYALKDDGNRYTVTVSTTNNSWIYVDSEKLRGYQWVKIQIMKSDTTTAVATSTNRSFEYLAQKLEDA